MDTTDEPKLPRSVTTDSAGVPGEHSLPARDASFRLLIEHASDVVTLLSGDGTVLYQSPSLERVLGHDPRDRIGKNVFTSPLVHPEDLPAKRDFLARALASPGATMSATFRLRHDDGSWRHIEAIGRNLVVEPGVGAIVAIYRDVTERWQAERRRAIEYEVSQILSEAPSLHDAARQVLQVVGEGLGWDYGGVWIVDRERRVLRCEATWSTPGVDLSRFIAASREMVFAPGDGLPGSVWAGGEPRWIVDTADSGFLRLRAATQEGLRSGFGLPIRLNGHVIAVIEFFSCEVRHSDPDVLEFVTVLSSVLGQFAERKRAEAAQRARAEQQQGIAAFGEFALATPDVAAVMEEAVAVVARTLGVERCKLLELLPDGEALLVRAGVGWSAGVGRETMPAGTGSQGGYTLLIGGPVISRDLRTETRFRPAPLLLAHGVVSTVSVAVPGESAPFGVLLAGATEWRGFTEDDAAFLRAMANVLATAIRRRDFEERLAREHAETERLEALEQARAEFVASMSHELKTPLTAVRASLGFLDMHASAHLDREGRQLLGTSRQSVQRLGFLIDDLLAYNQLASSTFRLDLEALDLREVVHLALPEVQPLIEQQAQVLATDLSSPMPVQGDAQRLAQVVINLLANANRHTPAGTRITVTGQVMGGHAHLSVADDGPGIPGEELEVIFQRFYRPRASRTPGSGLGLAIAKQLVELHSGRIWVQSALGRGTAFHVALPVREEAS